MAPVELTAMTFIWVLWSIPVQLLNLSLLEHFLLFLITINTSTGMLYKIIREYERITESEGKLLTSMATFEDLVVYIGLSIFLTFTFDQVDALDIFVKVSQVIVLAVVLVSSGMVLFRFIFRRQLAEGDLFTIIILVIAILYATISSSFGFSPFFGSFLAGVALASSIDVKPIIRQLSGLKELGLLLYFTSVGALIPRIGFGDVSFILPIIIAALGVVGIKFFSLSIASWISGNPIKESFRLGIYMMPISEFGVIITSEALARDLAESIYLTLAIYILLISSIMGSILARYDLAVASFFDRIVPVYVKIAVERSVNSLRQTSLSYAFEILWIFMKGLGLIIVVSTIISWSIPYMSSILPAYVQPYITIVILSMGIGAFSISILSTWHSYIDLFRRILELRIAASVIIISTIIVAILTLISSMLFVYILFYSAFPYLQEYIGGSTLTLLALTGLALVFIAVFARLRSNFERAFRALFYGFE